ncbi:sigma-70 family RNA polymerase sigma factor [Flavisphingomonas formosensis]|uniref:sigma-70 family RNA polymerase sigma factor n=1 Tax=Flavisphingomonas formosensis TaxID=861534 RepID=UPI0012F79C4D|nr:sigma-70 family RNA polymerase sigma factor [Sphingomonas formosensis]
MASALADGNAEASLWLACRAGSQAARERLFERHHGFALAIARRHHRLRDRGDLDLADLRQWAYSGLLEAIDRFDPDHGTPFRGYATRRISGSILNGINQMSEVREQIASRAQAERDRLHSLAPSTPPRAKDAIIELAELIGSLAIGFMLEGTSLYVDDEAGQPAPQPSAYDSAEWRELIGRLHAELAALPERERMILRHHYLSGVGFEQIADLLGLSKGRISQLHRAALVRLRQRLTQRGHFTLQR